VSEDVELGRSVTALDAERDHEDALETIALRKGAA
jgi:hypothetical protein